MSRGDGKRLDEHVARFGRIENGIDPEARGGVADIRLLLVVGGYLVAELLQLGRVGLIDLPWSPPKLDSKAEGPVRYPIADFFLANAICRNSPTMQRCSEELVRGGLQEAAE